MLDIKSLDVQNTLNNVDCDVATKRKILSLALGVVVSRKLLMPSNPVNTILDYYTTVASKEALNKIYSFNEQLVVDTSYAEKACKSYFLVRYNNAYPSTINNYIVDSDYDFYCKIAGVDMYVDREMYLFTNENKVNLLKLVNQLNVYLAD